MSVAVESKQPLEILAIAKRQKALIYAFVLAIASVGVGLLPQQELPPVVGLALFWLPLAMMFVFVVLMARLCWKVYGKAGAVLMTLLSVVPLLNLLAFLAANSRATRLIRSRGHKVGFMGADIKQMAAAC